MDKTYSSLGLDVQITGLPESVEQFNEMAGRDCCLEYATNHYVMHSHLTKVRKAICEVTEKLTGIERKKEENDGKVKFLESEATYINRVGAELEDEGGLEAVHGAAISDAVAGIEVDLTKTVRTGGGAKVAQKWKDMAASLEEQGKLEAFCEKHNVTLTGEEEEDAKLSLVGNKIRLLVLEEQKRTQDAVLSV